MLLSGFEKTHPSYRKLKQGFLPMLFTGTCRGTGYRTSMIDLSVLHDFGRFGVKNDARKYAF